MPQTDIKTDSVAKKLQEINMTLQNLLIVKCAQAGMKKADVRRIVRCDMNQITRIWKHIKVKAKVEE
jgi:transposase